MEMAIRGNQNKWLTVDVAEFIPEFVDCALLCMLKEVLRWLSISKLESSSEDKSEILQVIGSLIALKTYLPSARRKLHHYKGRHPRRPQSHSTMDYEGVPIIGVGLLDQELLIGVGREVHFLLWF
jgi:hypothetical protein